jgi:intein/homing endonuclease
MVDKLIEYGINPRKTYEIDFKFNFNILPSEDLKIHFLRGFFDGDGCVTNFTDKRWKKKYSYTNIGFVATSKSFILQISEFYKNYGIHFKLKEQKSKNMKYYQIWIHENKSVRRFKTIMYNNSNFFLYRKFNKFLE